MILSTLVLLAALAGQSAPAPLAPAREGKLQCYVPDAAKKTCQAIAGYEPQPDGSYRNTAKVLIAPERSISMETVSTVQVKGAAICGVMARADLLAGRVLAGNTPLPKAQADPILERIATALAAAGTLDKETCTTYTPDGTQLKAEVTVDGVARPDFTQPVIWVSPSDGFTLGTP